MPNPELHPWVTAAIAWVVLCVFGFAVLGSNHVRAGQPDAPRLVLLAGMLAAFLVSIGLMSAWPRSNAALPSNLFTLGAVSVAAVLVPRNPALMSGRWSVAGRRSSILIVSSVRSCRGSS